MKYAYYPGCSLHSTAKEYDQSLRAVCEKAGIELKEAKGWICCGSTPAHTTSRLLSLALPLRNLAQIEGDGFNEVIVPCAACFSRFKTAQHEIENQPQLRAELEDIIERKLGDGVRVSHPLEILADDTGLDTLSGLTNKDLSGLKVVCYYGCLLTRPPKVMHFDDDEYPQSMDRVLQAVGICTLDWSYKTDCCGGNLILTRPDISRKLIQRLLDMAEEAGADCIVTGCPMCFSNLDSWQKSVSQESGKEYRLPVFYFSELMGVAYTAPATQKWLGRHIVDTRPLLKQKELI